MNEVATESLQIVGAELAVTINDARAALEQFAEGEGGPNVLDRCAQLLHTAAGVLRLTETYGASLLAEEMEATCAHLSHSRGQAAEESIDALSRAAVQLPAYVERILNGGRDIPLVLLPLLNDLRAARGKPLLSESTLLLLNVFTPAGDSAPQPERSPSGEDLVRVCREVRPRFQLALLGWIKGADAERNLRHMGEIATRLEQAATETDVHRLWWVVAGVLEALLHSGLESSVSLKRLMGQADREMKRLIGIGEARYARQAPRELINNLLYYVARVPEPTERVAAIRETYRLEELVPADTQVEAVRESLAAPSAKLMGTVAEAIRDDLARVKDVLDIYVRTGMQHVEELTPQIELLKKIGDTLGVLGLGELREIVGARREELSAITAAGGIDEGDASQFVAMAADLLNVEQRLDEELLRLIAPAAGENDSAATATDDDQQFQEVSQAVMRECVVNLARVKEVISQVLEHAEEGASLDNIPPLLSGISAGLLILEKTEAVGVVEDVGSSIDALVQQGYQVADRQKLDLLADSIVSLEYYLETLQAGRREPLYMLENARRCIAALEGLASSVPEVSDTGAGMDTTLQIVDSSATLEALDPRAMGSVPELRSGEDRPDPEIIELFIEEAGEEIDSINRHFPVWVEDPHNEQALANVRRSFHTLKGSGRMVGAELIGEFAWSVESLLNKVINKTMTADATVTDFLREAIDTLPQLLEQLEVGTEVSADIAALMATAATLSGAEAVPAPDASAPEADQAAHGEPAADEVIPEPAEGAQTAEDGVSLDPVLLEILAKEVSTHLAEIRSFVADCRSGLAPFPVPESLHRSCHTLHGSATMAKATEAADVTGPLNKLVRRAFDHDVPVDVPVVDAVEAAADALEWVLAAMAAGETGPDTEALQVRLLELDEAVEAQAASRPEPRQGSDTEQAVEAESDPAPDEQVELSDGVDFELPVESGDTPAEESVAFDAEIAGIFADEAAELLESIDASVLALADDNSASGALTEIQRDMHTLKGGARMAGLTSMGDLSHELETLVIGVNSGRLELGASQIELVQSVVDELHRMREVVVGGEAPVADVQLVERLTAAQAGIETEEVSSAAEDEVAPSATVDTLQDEIEAPSEFAEDGEKAEAAPSEEDLEDTEPEEPAALDTPPATAALDQISQLAKELEAPAQPAGGSLSDLLPAAASTEPARADRAQFARVDPQTLEQLLNNAGEISIFHSRLAQQMGQIQFNLEELGQTVIRLKDQLRSLEIATEAQILYLHQSDMESDEAFDPLELDRYSRIQQLSRALAETASDVNSLKDLLHTLTSDTEAMLGQQSRTAAELQDGLMRTRMVPFEQQLNRLSRLLRQTAAEHGRQAELTLRGGGEIDRQVLEKMLPPFEHMLRNAVIHGIETPEEREQRGKPAAGTVAINLRREGSEVVIDVADDGRGLDLDAIRAKAIDQGIIDPAAELTDEEAMQLILRSGFSTADKLTQSAGRGIGMDVVANEITKLGGTLRMASDAGVGTSFTVRLPFTLAVTQALIVRTGAELYALPLPTVEGIIRVSHEEFDSYMAADEPAIDYAGQRYRFQHLGQFLGLGPSRISPDEERISITLVRAGENSTALIADEMLDSREIVVKPVGEQLAAIRGIAGATILGDGRVVVILDVGALVRNVRPALEPVVPLAEPEGSEQPVALVVDDSITMRRVTQRLLERNDFAVVTAKDGVEAVGVLQEQRPDIILLDVEMPRMDGYEFATHVRNNPDSERVPIIMITSRVSEKHRARAIELGVNDYLGKPYQEQELMDAVNQLLGLTET